MELKKTRLDLDIRYTAFDEKERKVLVKRFESKGKLYFRVRIFLEGPDLKKIDKVIYTLHPTFPKPRREISNGRNFELTIWTWGFFNLSVEIFSKDGGLDEREIHLDYSNDIQIAKTKNLLFWDKNNSN
jgi:transcription initiation factor IIF auxiliary subunit